MGIKDIKESLRKPQATDLVSDNIQVRQIDIPVKPNPINNPDIKEKLDNMKAEPDDDKPKPWTTENYEITGIQDVIETLRQDDKIDWNRKASLKNFRYWLDIVSEKLMEEKRLRDDTLFEDK